MSGTTPPAPSLTAAPSVNDESEKKLENLVARELRIAKREKEISAKQADLDRKLKMADDQEEKLGSMTQREIQLEQGNAALANAQKEVKRREKQVRDAEVAIHERESRIAELEARLQLQLEGQNQRDLELNQRDTNLQDALQRASEMSVSAQERCVRLEDDAKALDRRQEELQNAERTMRRKEQNIAEDEAEQIRKRKELREKEEALEKLQQALQARQSAMTTKEVQNQTERDRLTRLSKQLEEDERSRQVESAALAVKREELHKQQCAADESRRLAAIEVEEAETKIAEAEKKIAIQERLTMENLQLQRELTSTKTELATADAELKKRERRFQADTKEMELREAQLNKKRLDVEQLDRDTRAAADALQERQAQFESDQAMFIEEKAKHEKDFAALAQLEENMKKRMTALAKKEEELLAWMKEMEWREMMLMDRESVLDRAPCPVITPTGLSSSVLSTVGITAAGRRKKSERRQTSTMSSSVMEDSVTLGSSTRAKRPSIIDASLLSSDDAKAYSKTLIDVQLRRLKDQYVSAQLNWASLEVQERGQSPPEAGASSGGRRGSTADGASHIARASSFFAPSSSRTRVRVKSGIATNTNGTANGADADTEVARLTSLETKRAQVHRLSTAFLRMVAKLRAFDVNEPEDSLQRRRELDLFAEEERSLVSFAINLEYLTRHLETAIFSLVNNCPLDEKDSVSDARELLQKTSSWWVHQKSMLEQHLSVTLQDRKMYLMTAVAVLEEKQECIPALCPQQQTPNALRHETGPLAAGGDTPTNGKGKGVVVEHVAQSPILQPRGAAVLRASKLMDIQLEAAADRAAAERREAEAQKRTTDKRRSVVTMSLCADGGSMVFDERTAGRRASLAQQNESKADGDVPTIATSALRAGLFTMTPPAGELTAAFGKPSDSRGATPQNKNRPAESWTPFAAADSAPAARPGTSQSVGCGAARGAFGTLTDEAVYCLMTTGRAQSAQGQKAPRQHGNGLEFARGSPAKGAVSLQRRLHDFVPPASWGSSHHASLPKVLLDAAAELQEGRATPESRTKADDGVAFVYDDDGLPADVGSVSRPLSPTNATPLRPSLRSPYLAPVVSGSNAKSRSSPGKAKSSPATQS